VAGLGGLHQVGPLSVRRVDDPDETAVVQVDHRPVEPELLLLPSHPAGVFLGGTSLEVRWVDGVEEVGGSHGLW
jgi:hypothetical protein